MTDHGWPPLQSDLEVHDVLRAVEDEKERAHYDEELDVTWRISERWLGVVWGPPDVKPYDWEKEDLDENDK